MECLYVNAYKESDIEKCKKWDAWSYKYYTTILKLQKEKRWQSISIRGKQTSKENKKDKEKNNTQKHYIKKVWATQTPLNIIIIL